MTKPGERHRKKTSEDLWRIAKTVPHLILARNADAVFGAWVAADRKAGKNPPSLQQFRMLWSRQIVSMEKALRDGTDWVKTPSPQSRRKR